MPLADPWVLWVFGRVGQGYGDKPSLEGVEGGSVDGGETSEEVPAAYPGEALDLSLGASMIIYTRTNLIIGCVIPEGDG